MTLYMPLFRSCSTLRPLTQLHAHLVITGLHNDPLASTKLLESYAQMGSLQSSRLVFDTHPSPDSFMLGVLIKCYLWNHLFHQVISLYNHHHTQNCSFVYPSVLRAVSGLGHLIMGRKIHGRIVKSGFCNDPVIGTALLGMYGESWCIDDARKMFDEMLERDLFSWSSIISCYVENGNPREGMKMLRSMVSEGIRPDSVMLLSVAAACAKVACLRLAKSVHGYVIRNGMVGDASLSNSLIIMYSQCGYLWIAEGLFESLTGRSTACWTSMISSYNQNGFFQKALDSFIQMQESEVEPNAVTMISVLYSCARLGRLKEGKSVHCFILRKAMDADDLDLGPALIDFYAACWKITTCQKLLYLIGNSNVVSWNTLISFYDREGLYEEAMVLFALMLAKGLVPDSFSLASSISASASAGSIQFGQQIHSHVMKRGLWDEFVQNSLMDMYSKCGFVDLAYTIFDKISQKSIVTWNCMICGFSQNGISLEALNLVDQIIWGALLNGCRIHGRMDLIKSINRELREISTDDTGYYTLLSNIHAEGGNWYESRKVRLKMEGMGLKKVPGYSSIEIDRKIYRFGAGDTSEWQMKEIYMFLENFQSLAQGQDVECYNTMYGTSMFFEDYNVYNLQKETSNCIWNKSVTV
ncbi:unnamed protein product [Lupinus luteus]|uniref:Pentatricopeptide repeat-containing protein n=1 Tax=Lupinus luteus TaxID=3873 RepID=A0AAV1X134_LUPLU